MADKNNTTKKLGDKKKAGTKQAPGKKSMSPKLKTTIRRGVAGVCLASSLLIAAIPSDRSGSAEAAATGNRSEVDVFDKINEFNGVIDNTFDFDADLNDRLADPKNTIEPDENGPDLTMATDTGFKSGVKEAGFSYDLIKDGSSYKLQRKFKYYKDADSNGVIYGLASEEVGSDRLTISSNIITSYDYYTPKEYENGLKYYFDYKYVIKDPTKGAYKIAADADWTTADMSGTQVSEAEMNELFCKSGHNANDVYTEWAKFAADHPVKIAEGSDETRNITYSEAIDPDFMLARFNTTEVWAESEDKNVFTPQVDIPDEILYKQFILKNNTDRYSGAKYTEANSVSKCEVTLVEIAVRQNPANTPHFFESPDQSSTKTIYCYGVDSVDKDAIAKCYNLSSSSITWEEMPDKIYVVVSEKSRDAMSDKEKERTDENGFYLARKNTIINSIGESAFDAKKAGNIHPDATAVYIDPKILYIGDNAFRGPGNASGSQSGSPIKEVDCEGVIYVGNGVFDGCTNLSRINYSADCTTIGNKAFYNCDKLESISIKGSVRRIGCAAFAECDSLKSVDFDSFTHCAIGDYAFYNDSNLENVSFPSDRAVSLGKACFAVKPGMGTAKMTKFAFPKYIESAASASGADGPTYEIYGANFDPWEGYAVYIGGTTKVDDDNPSETSCKYESIIGDFILAGRSSLTDVHVFSNTNISSLKRIPMNTFMGCEALKNVWINDPVDENTGKQPNPMVDLAFDSNIFRDSKVTGLCVYGERESKNGSNDFGNKTEPNSSIKYPNSRVCTWGCYSYVKEYVPFSFNDGQNDHYEIGCSIKNKADEYDALLFDLMLNGDDATIINCIELHIDGDTLGISEEDPFSLPAEVDGKRVRSLGPNCLDNIKDKIQFLRIPAGSLDTVGDNVFSDCEKLEWVQFGGGDKASEETVKNIGKSAFSDNAKLREAVIGKDIAKIDASAFAGCPLLKDIFWDEPENTSAEVAIDSTAFKTDSGELYFHGYAEDKAYAPFSYAMADNYLNSSHVRICYCPDLALDDEEIKSLNLTDNELLQIQRSTKIIRENTGSGNGDILLIGYTGIDDLPAAVLNNLSSGPASMLLDSTKNVKVPAVVESIDVCAEFADTKNSANNNKRNWVYLNDNEKEWYGITSPASDGTSPVGAGSVDVLPGLFSGGYKDIDDINNYDSGKELDKVTDDARGNDWITSLSMPGVKKLHERALDSCERLQSVTLGSDLMTVEDEAFKDCDNLQSILFPDGNSKFTFLPYILYENENDDGSGGEIINTVLPFYGVNDPNAAIGSSPDEADMLSKVVAINDTAFRGCDEIAYVDLSATKIEDIPEDLFDGCSSLEEVRLPETCQVVEQGAFTGVMPRLDVYIPSENTVIDKDCFDPYNDKVRNKIYIHSPKYSKSYDNTNEVRTSADYKHINWVDNTLHIVKFFNGDGSLIGDPQELGDGGHAKAPDPSLVSSNDANEVFDYWECTYWDKSINDSVYCTGADTYTNVYQDRNIHPVFKKIEVPEETYYVYFVNNKLANSWPQCMYTGLKEGDPFPYGPEEMGLTMIPEYLTPAEDYVFDKWTFVKKDNNNQEISSSYVHPHIVDGNYECVANYKLKSSGGGGEDDPTAPTDATGHTLTVTKGTGSGTYKAGRTIVIQAFAPDSSDMVFDKWKVSDKDVQIGTATVANTYVVMPDHDVTVEATYKKRSESDNKTTGTGTPTPTRANAAGTTTPTPTGGGGTSANGATYNVIVENGAGSGVYRAGDVVTLTAYAAAEDKVFDRWTTSNADIGFANALAINTTFIMPTHDVKATATYRSRAASENKTTGTPTPTGGAQPTRQDTTSEDKVKKEDGNAGDKDKGNTDVIITTEAIDNNKKNMGYATVAGSTDNFIVKVTDSAAASAAVEQALRAAYGDRFDNVKYTAFDISLYDSTGTYLVSNANDLAVNITLPLPDSLVEYAGNNRAGVVVDSQLRELAVQYTTIDGVPCIRFTATHFSPYTIYVDTNNIVRGKTDLTPKTGDGIAPKWFLSAGMLSLSCVLFLWKDKKNLLALEAKKEDR